MDLQEEIRKVAYELYEKSGRMGGREVENWLAAEKIVMARHARSKQPAESPSVKKVTRPTAKKTPAQSAKAEPGKTKTGPKKTTAGKPVKSSK